MCIAFIEQLIRMEIPEASTNRGWRLMGLFGTFPNPGRFDDLKAAAANLLAHDNFEGARFEFNKTIRRSSRCCTMFPLQRGNPAHTSSVPTLATKKRCLRAASTWQAGSRAASTRSWATARTRPQAQVAPEAGSNSFRADVDYKGGSFFGGGYFMGGGLVGASYLQSVSPGLAVGAEGFLHTGNRKVRGGSGAARYTWGGKGEHVLALKAGSFGQGNMAEVAYSRKVRHTPAMPSVCPRLSPHAHRSPSDCTRLSHVCHCLCCLGCLAQVSEKVALATEMQYYHNQLCTFGLGYQFNLRTAVFKGHIASDTTCSAVLEEHIQPGINLILSGQLNHKKNDYKFGVGLNVGGA